MSDIGKKEISNFFFINFKTNKTSDSLEIAQ